VGVGVGERDAAPLADAMCYFSEWLLGRGKWLAALGFPRPQHLNKGCNCPLQHAVLLASKG